MQLVELFDYNPRAILNEGGNIWAESSPFDQAIAPQLMMSTNKYLRGLNLEGHLIGSAATPIAGKMSGDLDVLVDECLLEKALNTHDPKTARQEFERYLQGQGLKTRKTGTTVHILLPFQGKFYQVDLKIIKNADRIKRFHIHSLPKNSPFKGLHKLLLMNALATSQGFLWNADEGLYLRDENGKKADLLTDDLDEVAKYLIGSHASASDLGSAESIITALPNSPLKNEVISMASNSGRWGDIKPTVESIAIQNLRNTIQESLKRTGNASSAVLGWGRGMGHKGHMFLASSVLTQAKKIDADPYFVVSRSVGKDDPITPDEKLGIYHKVFPNQKKIFFAATDEMPDLNSVLHKLQEMGYKQVIIVVGEDQVNALSYVKKYNGLPNKKGEIPFSFDKLDVISRQQTDDPSAKEPGPRATPMREILLNPIASKTQKFDVWRSAMNSEISDTDVMLLMKKAAERLGNPLQESILGSLLGPQPITESTAPIRQDGWIRPNGAFIANQPNSGHFETLKKLGINSYEDAYNKGWIHISTYSYGLAYLESAFPMSKIVKRLEKIAKMSEGLFPEISVKCSDGDYEWTGKEFIPYRPRNRMYEGVKKVVDLRAPDAGEFIKKNGSKTAPITDKGWLFPSGRFVPNGYSRSHTDTAYRMGFFRDYDDAFDAGLIRVSNYGGKDWYFETPQKMSPKLENLVVKAIKRIPNLVGFELRSGSGTGYFKTFEWNGKELVPIKNRTW